MPSFDTWITVEENIDGEIVEYDTLACVEYSRDGMEIILEHVTYTNKQGKETDVVLDRALEDILSERCYQHLGAR